MELKDKLKDLADKVSDAVDKGVKSGKDGYQKLAEKNRINKEIRQLNSEITELFLNIGKDVYANSPDCEKYQDSFADIKDKEAKLASLNRQISLLDGMIICTECGKAIPADSKVCNQCGADVVQPEVEKVEAEVINVDETNVETNDETDVENSNVCPSCGATFEEGSAFCSKCGTKLS